MLEEISEKFLPLAIRRKGAQVEIFHPRKEKRAAAAITITLCVIRPSDDVLAII